MPMYVLNVYALHVLFHLIPQYSLLGRDFYHHFTEEEMNSQSSPLTFPRTDSYKTPSLSHSRTHILCRPHNLHIIPDCSFYN